ncbi:MAG: BON domain-containing protein [Polyangiaceae bacterium]|nr:BON domain-containing protein [Polyangiaceae bacterium]
MHNRNDRDNDYSRGEGRERQGGRDYNEEGRFGEFSGRGEFGEGRADMGRRDMEREGSQLYRGGGGESRYGHGFGQGSYDRGYGQQERGGLGGRNYSEQAGSGWSSRYGEQGGGMGGRGMQERGFGGRGDMGEWGGGMGGRGMQEGGFGGQGSQMGGSCFGMTGGYGGTSMTRSRGQHGGRGPRGYKRSDERIREDICDRLMQHDDVDASDVEVTVSSGEVTLQGTVESRQMKHLIEDVIDAVQGVQEVHNQIRVKRQTMGSERSTQGEFGTQSRTSEALTTTTGSSSAMTTSKASHGQEAQKTEGKTDKNQESKNQGSETRRN